MSRNSPYLPNAQDLEEGGARRVPMSHNSVGVWETDDDSTGVKRNTRLREWLSQASQGSWLKE